jgi:2'-5' RNA ligase
MAQTLGIGITLKQPFIPKVDTEVIVGRLRSVAAGTGPFVVVLNGFDYFEGERNLAFIAVEGSKPLRDLHYQIVTSLRGLGEGGEEHQLTQFVPHLTIHDAIPRDRLASFKAELAARGFHAEAALDSIVLFANDGAGWKHVARFQLTGKRNVSGWERI